MTYEERVNALIAEGLDRGDAQAAVDAEDLQTPITAGQIVKGAVAGTYVVLGLRMLNERMGAQLKPVNPDDHTQTANGEIWLPLDRITPAH